MSRAYQLPVRTELATRTGPRLWRKTVLKTGHISKGDVELDVDRNLLQTLAANFAAGAKDQVPFVLVDARNRHNELPERIRGEVLDLQVTDDGRLDAVFAMSARGDALLADNPRLGASVSFIDRFQRADGRDYGPTLLHVAGTHDPEIAGLGEWTRADLAAEAGEVIDLSGPDTPDVPAPAGADLPAEPGGPHPDTEKEAGPMPAPTPLTDDELATLRALLARVDTPVGEPDPDPAAQADEADELDDVADGDLDAADVDQPELVAASADTGEALHLANARLDAQAIELAALRAERDTERYERERDQLAREFGIPPTLTDLCRPWLTGTRTVQLSSGESRDPGADIRKLLREFGRVAKLLDLSGPVGSAHELSAADAERSERDAFLDQARASGFAR